MRPWPGVAFFDATPSCPIVVERYFDVANRHCALGTLQSSRVKHIFTPMARLQSPTVTDNDKRPSKRVKFDTSVAAQPEDSTADQGSIVRRHPLGVRPSGNALTASTNCKSSAGSFALLPDELLMHLLETLQVPHLLRIGATCKALHAFTRSEELWRTLFIE